MERNIQLLLSYDGTGFQGFQVQPKGRTVQGELQRALCAILGHPVQLIGAGRTDSGVHALGQVVNFHAGSGIPVERLPMALNYLLRGEIQILQAREVAPTFHARYDCIGKTYLYILDGAESPSPFRRNQSWWVGPEINWELVQQATIPLLGRHDFSAFQATGSSARDPVRTITKLMISTQGDFRIIRIEGDGFLYRMVRNIVAMLLAVGQQRLSPTQVPDLLEAKDRGNIPPTAPAQGLYLAEVRYD